MNRIETHLPDVILIEPKKFGDSRGYFFESFNQRIFSELTGVSLPFVQDNQSRSTRGVLRGLHYQIQQAQGKLIRVLEGAIHDVAVDLRRTSATFGRSASFVLSAQNNLMAWIPPGFAHGFLALEEGTTVLYKATDFYAPAYERTLLWNDPALGLEWPLEEVGGRSRVIVSEKDLVGKPLAEAEVYGTDPAVPGSAGR
ncbi:MAG TPA: dTDP-4-dehydrorhamnose 3,5-epimerase [Lautropia sp.]|jgi:dTDP-4-dehydrorhamnose 3,5-epimerase|nr:dTDP-4-dehydrorhamnose 3,5-epimerase [Lautropia sp.]